MPVLTRLLEKVSPIVLQDRRTRAGIEEYEVLRILPDVRHPPVLLRGPVHIPANRDSAMAQRRKTDGN